jgi:hypothetical protein
MQFKASQGKKFGRPHLEKKKSQKRAGREAQGVGSELKPKTFSQYSHAWC